MPTNMRRLLEEGEGVVRVCGAFGFGRTFVGNLKIHYHQAGYGIIRPMQLVNCCFFVDTVRGLAFNDEMIPLRAYHPASPLSVSACRDH